VTAAPPAGRSHLRRLLDCCDVTAAAFARYQHNTFFLSVIPDFEPWQAEVSREYGKLLAVAARMFAPADRLFHALACVRDLYKHALSSLKRAEQGGPHQDLDAVAEWLLTMWNVGEYFPAPQHDRFHQFHGDDAERVAEQAHEHKLQRARVIHYQLSLRSDLLGLFTLAGEEAPDETADRRRWFGGSIGLEVIGDEELCRWFCSGLDPTPAIDQPPTPAAVASGTTVEGEYQPKTGTAVAQPKGQADGVYRDSPTIFGMRWKGQAMPFDTTEREELYIVEAMWPPEQGKRRSAEEVKSHIGSKASFDKWPGNKASDVSKVLGKYTFFPFKLIGSNKESFLQWEDVSPGTQ
jgi:hypothetical protein